MMVLATIILSDVVGRCWYQTYEEENDNCSVTSTVIFL